MQREFEVFSLTKNMFHFDISQMFAVLQLLDPRVMFGCVALHTRPGSFLPSYIQI